MGHPEGNFDDLRKLLGCKRYEQPPPGYFLSFSDKVIARIEAEEVLGSSSWWDRFLDKFDAKPVLLCAYGLAVSGLLFLGLRLSQAFDAEANPNLLSGPWFASSPASFPLELSSALSRSEFMETVPVSHSLRARNMRRQDLVQCLVATNILDTAPAAFPSSIY